MSLVSLLTETATVVRYGTAVNELGDVVRGPSTTVSYPARLEQLSTEEVLRDRDTVIADWRLFLPPDADVSPYDTVQARAHVFEVRGLPNEQRSPRGTHHVEVRLKFVA